MSNHAPLMGRMRYLHMFCECCNKPRTNKHTRTREKQAWRKEQW